MRKSEPRTGDLLAPDGEDLDIYEYIRDQIGHLTRRTLDRLIDENREYLTTGEIAFLRRRAARLAGD